MRALHWIVCILSGISFSVKTLPLYLLFLNMFDKFLGIAHLTKDSEFLVRSEIKLCKLHLNKLQEDLDVYVDRYGIIYADFKATMIALDHSVS